MLDFVDFLCERRRMQLRKEAGKPYPWSEDHALNQARINNVYREHDSYSRWEHDYCRCYPQHAVKAVIIGRFFMSIQATALLSQSDNPEYLRETCDYLSMRGVLFNPCVAMEPPDTLTQVDVAMRFMRDVPYVTRHILQCIDREPEHIWEHLKGLTDLNSRIELRHFRQYEMMTSLSYLHATRFYEDDFLHIGPGAQDECQAVFGHQPKDVAEGRSMAYHIKQILERKRFEFASWPDGTKWHAREPRKFTLRQLEDGLCEYRKYKRSYTLGDELPEKYIYTPKGRDCTNAEALKGTSLVVNETLGLGSVLGKPIDF